MIYVAIGVVVWLAALVLMLSLCKAAARGDRR